MTFKTILFQLLDDEAAEMRLLLVRDLAIRFDATVIAMHVTPPPVVPVSYGEGVAYTGTEIIEAQVEAAENVRKRLEAMVARQADPNLHWRHAEGDPGDALVDAARTVDLVVSPQAHVTGVDALAAQTIERLLLDSGTPTLMLPARLPGTADFGGRIVIGWNGARDAARALRDSLPFLVLAENVRLITLGDEQVGVEAAAAMLARHDVTAEIERLEAGPKPGHLLLDAATARDAGLLVMGAYGHSRWREVILGGATREVLGSSAIPVFFSG